jgi:hypothetical protein
MVVVVPAVVLEVAKLQVRGDQFAAAPELWL